MSAIDLDEHLVREAERVAADRGETLSSFVEDALRDRLARAAEGNRRRAKTRLPTVPGWGLKPGVDLDNSARLLEIMDELGRPM
jgi:hypothetical protein